MKLEAAAHVVAQNAVSLKAQFEQGGRNVDEFINYVAAIITGYQEAAHENRRMLMDLFTVANRQNQPMFST